MLIAIQGPKYQKDKREDDNWLIPYFIQIHFITIPQRKGFILLHISWRERNEEREEEEEDDIDSR